ncbi:Uma2 family endonuclease [Sorangium sp. So ce1000]|uniref:Uma2 family endonuclease n=1 Tax=Sorangium sp. So ce1000 TaxID=3133325 RepID=UPI003F62D6C1
MGEKDKEGNAPGSTTEGMGVASAPRDSAERSAKELATALACAIDVVALFAAPRVLARACSGPKRLPARDEIAKAIEDCAKALGAGAGEMPAIEPIHTLQALLISWEPGKPVPQAMVEAARAWLRSVGVPEPDEGWDRWEGSRDEPEPARAAPTPRALRAEPMTIDEWAKLDGPGELVDGLLVEEEATTPLHDAVVDWFLDVLRAWASPRGAVVFGPGHKLVVSKLGGRKPDICVYTAGELPEADANLSSRPPALVIEVVSPQEVDEWTDFEIKDREYARLGVRRYWLVEPTQRFLVCLELGPGERYTMFVSGRDQVKIRVTGLDGLALDLSDLWAKVDPSIPGTQGEIS